MPLPEPPAEWVEIDGEWGLYWWIEVDWNPLFDGAEYKGDDTDISHAPGSYVNVRQLAETEFICNGYLFADRGFDGTDYSGDTQAARSNLRTLLAFWRGYIASPTRPTSPLRDLVVHDEAGVDWGAEVIIDRKLKLTKDDDNPLAFRIEVRVTVPSGELIQVGS